MIADSVTGTQQIIPLIHNT